MAFFAELKRRRVGKVAIAYGTIAWLVTEAASVVLPALRLPEWTVTFIVVFLLVGFPIAMVLAWIFDVGPQGIERTEPLAHEPRSAHLRLRIAYAAVVLLLMAGLGYLLYERGFDRAHAGEAHSSIAVLPFTNLSGDASRDYFSDGMSEELLNLLARVPGLQGRLAHLVVRLQGPQRRHPRGRPRTRRRDRARGQRAPVGRPGAHHGAADRRRDRLSPLVGDLRSAARGHLPRAGRDRRRDRGQAAHRARTAGAGARGARQGADAERRGLRAVPAGPGGVEAPRRGQPQAAPSTSTSVRSASTRASPAPTRRSPRPTSCCRATRARKGDEAQLLPMAETAARQALSIDPEHRRGARGARADQRRAWRPARRRVGILLRHLARAERGDGAPLVLDPARQGGAPRSRRSNRHAARTNSTRPRRSSPPTSRACTRWAATTSRRCVMPSSRKTSA